MFGKRASVPINPQCQIRDITAMSSVVRHRFMTPSKLIRHSKRGILQQTGQDAIDGDEDSSWVRSGVLSGGFLRTG